MATQTQRNTQTAQRIENYRAESSLLNARMWVSSPLIDPVTLKNTGLYLWTPKQK